MDLFNLLPDHILVEIFGNLSPKMIKCCALVCKRWDEIVGSSIELMKRFKINFCKSRNKVKEEYGTERKHQAAKIRCIEESLDFLSGQNLQSLNISYPFKTKLSLLVDTLNNLPSLKYLKVTGSFLDELPKDCLKKSKNNLIELSCDLKIMHIFDCITLEKLKLSVFENVHNDKMLLFVDFLCNQKNLKYFKIDDRTGGKFFVWPNLSDVNLPLLSLEYYCKPKPFIHYKLFIKFLDQHKNSLTSLKLQFCTKPKFGIEFIHKFALENIVNLKQLELGYFGNNNEDPYQPGDILRYNEIISASDITRNLESLEVGARSMDMNENRRFYDMFGNIKHLKFYFDIDDHIELLHCFHERFVNLESLHLNYLNCKIPETIYFPKLKELSIGAYLNEKHLCGFIRRHSLTLEKIDIQDEGDRGVNFAIEEMQYCPNLTFLHIYCIAPNSSVLETLNEIVQKSKSFILKAAITRLRGKIIFPDDKALWDEACREQLMDWH